MLFLEDNCSKEQEIEVYWDESLDLVFNGWKGKPVLRDEIKRLVLQIMDEQVLSLNVFHSL